MHPEQIKAEMRMKGVSPAMLAERINRSQTTVSNVINGRAVSEFIRAEIACVIGRPVSAIWAPSPPSLMRRKRASGVVAA